MGEPKGSIVVPLGFNPDEKLRSLEVDADDNLKTTLGATPEYPIGTAGWYSSAWHKNPLAFGISGRMTINQSTASATAGSHTMDTPLVPEDKIYVCQAVSAWDVNNPLTHVEFRVGIAGIGQYAFHVTGAVAANVKVTNQPHIVMLGKDFFRIIFNGTVLNDDLYFQSWGYYIDIV